MDETRKEVTAEDLESGNIPESMLHEHLDGKGENDE